MAFYRTWFVGPFFWIHPTIKSICKYIEDIYWISRKIAFYFTERSWKIIFSRSSNLSCSKKITFNFTGYLSTVNHISHGGFFIYIKLGILSLCTESWHGTRSISISWDFCLYWKAIWWIDYVYRYWLWTHTHLSTTFNLTLNCSLILTHVRRSDQYCRALNHINCCDSYNFMAKFIAQEVRWAVD